MTGDGPAILAGCRDEIDEIWRRKEHCVVGGPGLRNPVSMRGRGIICTLDAQGSIQTSIWRQSRLIGKSGGKPLSPLHKVKEKVVEDCVSAQMPHLCYKCNHQLERERITRLTSIVRI